MAIRTAEEYLAGLRDSRTVFQGGGRVEDVTAHPVRGICADHVATIFRFAHREASATFSRSPTAKTPPTADISLSPGTRTTSSEERS